MCLGAAIGGPAASTPEKGQWFAYPYNRPMTEQHGTAVVSPVGTVSVSPTGQNVSPGITPRWFAYSYNLPMKEQPGKVVGSPIGTASVSLTGQNASPGIPLDCTCNGVDVLAAPPEATPNSAPLSTELPPAELSLAMTPQGCGTGQASSSCNFPTSAGTSHILDFGDSSLISEGLETSEKSKPLSEKEELAALREALAELYANIIEQAGDKHCETLTDIAAASVLEWGLCALEQVWLSEGS